MRGARLRPAAFILLLALVATPLLMPISCSAQLPQFDERKAYEHLLRQVAFGPRAPGTPGHRACLEYLTMELEKYADKVTQQKFQHTFGPERRTVVMSNIIANFWSEKTKRVLLCAHWDTRPWADHDPDPANRATSIPGANDGASGVAVLLEIARLLKAHEPRFGVDIVLFDGEDCGQEGDDRTWAIGSRHFAESKDPRYRPLFGILLDMVGDADLEIYIEQHSQESAPDVVSLVWARAAELGVTEFIRRPKYALVDDHVPLLRAGIRCIDIIDYDYPYWHTLADTPDKCSAESLGKVGRVVLSVLYR
ncbi:MAG: M28 family peptidase [bacterium]|nr:M28 family peptidase [candidate division KSB1 bacterium]MDH7561403.1 M28 family peptidase [bacterium]